MKQKQLGTKAIAQQEEVRPDPNDQSDAAVQTVADATARPDWLSPDEIDGLDFENFTYVETQ
jgi:hypothetical protein